jgi:hypothetical protein
MKPEGSLPQSQELLGPRHAGHLNILIKKRGRGKGESARRRVENAKVQHGGY